MTSPHFRPVDDPRAPGFIYADADGDTVMAAAFQEVEGLEGPVVALTVADLDGAATMFVDVDHVEEFIERLRTLAAAARAEQLLRGIAATARAGRKPQG